MWWFQRICGPAKRDLWLPDQTGACNPSKFRLPTDSQLETYITGPDFVAMAVRNPSSASDQTILSIAGHVSKEMMERYSHIRTEAKRRALDAIAQTPSPSVFEDVVHQNVHQIEEGDSEATRKLLN